MGAVVFFGLLIIFGALIFFALRWSRPAPSAPDLHRADEAQADGLPDAKTVGDRVRSSITMFWPRW